MGRIRKLIKKLIFFVPAFIKREIIFQHSANEDYQGIYYSQEGEDIILEKYFERQKSGFYIDIGAYHPFRFSNTYKLYLRGWYGINIDANPEGIDLCKKYRSRDISINAVIALDEREYTYYRFKHPAHNTISDRESEQKIKNGKVLLSRERVTSKPLSLVLSPFIQKIKKIDYLNIDVEGKDLEVLESFPWDTYHPGLIGIETGNIEFDAINKSEIGQYLREKGYKPMSKTYNTTFFKFGEC